MSAHNYTPTELGVFGVSAEVNPEDARRALRAIFETVGTVHDLIDVEEVARAQSVQEARMLRSLETMEGQANFLAEWQSLGDWRMGLNYFEQLMSLGPAQIADAARRYLTEDRVGIVAYRPANTPSIAQDAAELHAWLAT